MTETNEATYPAGSVYVSRVAYGQEEVDTTPIEVPNFQGVPVARVTVTSHITKNLGNYESAKLGVEVSLPCFPIEEEIVRAYDKAQTLVAEILIEQLDGLK
jgi:hypothetical protein